MRTVVLLPLAMVIAAGCGREAGRQVSTSLPKRDLALPAQSGEVKVASPVELQQDRTHRTARSFRRIKRPTATEPKITLAAMATVPSTTLFTPVSVAQPAAPAEAANDRELAPGKTVTVIPASSGPSADPGSTADFPRGGTGGSGMGGGGSGMGGGGSGMGGGDCPGGRGPDIGIVGIPGPDFRIR
jgi:hypothetical protein